MLGALPFYYYIFSQKKNEMTITDEPWKRAKTNYAEKKRKGEKLKRENNELWELNDCYVAIPFKSK